MTRTAALLAMLLVIPWQSTGIGSQERPLMLRVKNDLEIARSGETVVVGAKEIQRFIKVTDWKAVHVIDPGSRQDLVTQSIDTDGDGAAELFLFQSDFKGREEKSFELNVGAPKIPTRDQFKAYGRFVRERYDDFAWENDRIAQRMYGVALETWQAEPLTSSAVDVWCKRVRRLVINDWYMVDNYHTDTGEGADLYSAGKSRGCGGSGIWENGKLYVSRNFTDTRVIANGPIRVVFELTYPAWDVNGRQASEIKRVTLDAGQNLDLFESFYKTGLQGETVYAAGIKKSEGSTMQSDRDEGWIRTWEPLAKGKSGYLGCGIIADPRAVVEVTVADGNYLVVARAAPGRPASYYAGFGWDRSGDFAGVNEWQAYLQQFAKRVRSPLKVALSAN